MLPKIYKDLMNLPGVSGNEKLVRNYMRSYIENFDNFEIHYDNLGSIFGVKKSKNPNAKTLMIAGHMDEVGFMVSHIDNNGFIKLQPLGGWRGEVLISQIMNIYLDDGKIIKGVIGSLPPHIKIDNKLDINDLLLDAGFLNKQEALDHGIKPGNMVLFDNRLFKTANGKRYVSKAIDNRFGCGLALEVIAKYNNIDLDVNLVVGASVQEEVGLRGAIVATKKFKPDVFIALDSSPINDLQDSNVAGLGKGFLLRLYDPRNVMHQGLINYFVKTAKKNKISYQDFDSKGGTDAAAAQVQNEGVLATTIGLPARYIHSISSMLDINDLKAARKMIYAVVESINENEIEKIKNGYFD